MNIGLPEILLIVFIAFLLFGARKLPDAARSIGKALNEFKRGFREPADELKDEVSGTRTSDEDHATPKPGT